MEGAGEGGVYKRSIWNGVKIEINTNDIVQCEKEKSLIYENDGQIPLTPKGGIFKKK